jgi:hypothetical protein
MRLASGKDFLEEDRFYSLTHTVCQRHYILCVGTEGKMIPYIVTMSDLRSGFEGRKYRREFWAAAEDYACRAAAAALLTTDGMVEGEDFEITGVMPA